ncbi:ATP synthase A1 subunit C [Candidatus Woesearchaeota archaeon]|nr:ATP synthase A1 subunit C [Candidatus Woesearchaeota archaeon]
MLVSKQKNLELGKYPYTYVRTVVMRSLLFKREDYQKMLKMGFSEIAKLLQDSHYKKEINEFAREYSDADLLELSLNRNLAESFKKLIRISPYELSLLVREYIKRKDIEDIKTIIRGKFTSANEKQILSSITAAGTLSYDFFISLLKKESIEEILKSSKMADFGIFADGLRNLRQGNTLVGIENTFDKFYYNQIIRFSKALPRQGALFRNFLLKEIEILNILTLLRLKRAKFGKESVKDFIILPGDNLKDAKIMKFAELDDLEELSRALEKTEYKNILRKGFEEFKKSGSLIMLEAELYKYLLKQSMLLLHQHPLSVDVILGYMFAKDIEVRNLKIIVKGKQLGLREDFIESQLVF